MLRPHQVQDLKHADHCQHQAYELVNRSQQVCYGEIVRRWLRSAGIEETVSGDEDR